MPGDSPEPESHESRDREWRQNMTDEWFIQINDELGPPASMDEELARYQIARAAANEFWDWVAFRGEKPADWRTRNDRMINQIYEAMMAKARRAQHDGQSGSKS